MAFPFRTHWSYAEGTRPGQVYPACEIENFRAENSDGQCGEIHAHMEMAYVTCTYCRWEWIKREQYYLYADGMTVECNVHYGVHPFFTRQGFQGWFARCGEINEHIDAATRDPNEVSCFHCLEQMIRHSRRRSAFLNG